MIATRRIGPRLRVAWLPALALVLSGSPAEAHLVTTGLGPVYDGISHFLTSPDDLVATFALALLAGQCGPDSARRALIVLPAAWLVGGLAGLSVASAHPPDLTWLIFMALGGLVAAQLRPPGAAVVTLASVLGLFKGFANGSAMGAAGAGIVWLIGVVTTVFVVTVIVAASVVAARLPIAKIAVRVLGSWTTATGMLMLGWSLR